MKKLIDEFKVFIMRGNVLDLAVGVVIGSAFTAIVNGMVSGLITPLIGMIIGLIAGTQNMTEAFSIFNVQVAGSTFMFGDVISAIITFLITGFVLFLIVKAANTAQTKLIKKDDDKKAEAPKCPFCLEEVKEGATRCPHCGGEFTEPAKAALPEAPAEA